MEKSPGAEPILSLREMFRQEFASFQPSAMYDSEVAETLADSGAAMVAAWWSIHKSDIYESYREVLTHALMSFMALLVSHGIDPRSFSDIAANELNDALRDWLGRR